MSHTISDLHCEKEECSKCKELGIGHCHDKTALKDMVMNKTYSHVMISSMSRQGISITHDQWTREFYHPVDSYHQEPISGSSLLL